MNALLSIFLRGFFLFRSTSAKNNVVNCSQKKKFVEIILSVTIDRASSVVHVLCNLVQTERPNKIRNRSVEGFEILRFKIDASSTIQFLNIPGQ